VLSKLPKLLLVGVLCLSLGLHWLLLQSVAWVGMVVKYSRTDSFKWAIVKTFDGQHPCTLCKVVQAGKKSEKKHDAQKPVQKLDPFCLSESNTLGTSLIFPLITGYSPENSAFTEGPPKPPPRSFRA
jgi:hypothetical protein